MNPLSFGIPPHLELTALHLNVGAFIFDRNFILDNFTDEEDLVQIHDLPRFSAERNRDHIGLPLIDFRGDWAFTKGGDTLERRLNPECHTVGD